MKKKFLFLLILIFLTPFQLLAEQVQLQWDYTTENQEKIDGFKLYQKKYWHDGYDFDTPIETLPPEARDTTIDVPPVIDKAMEYQFVIRAYKDEKESENSNQVEYTVVGIKPATPIQLTGEYNKSASIINLMWEQPQDEYDIYQWIVYYKLESENDYIELGRVDKGQALVLTKAFDIVAQGEEKTVYFTVISFRRDYNIHSENAQELALLIDRSGPPVVPDNLKINIEIPIQWK